MNHSIIISENLIISECFKKIFKIKIISTKIQTKYSYTSNEYKILLVVLK